MTGSGVAVSAAVEGDVDAAVVTRLLGEVGAEVGQVYGKKGKGHLRQRIRDYNRSAERWRWVVLVDLDDDECAPSLRDDWLPIPAPLMSFRVAVRAVEAWLLADRERVARFLGVAPSIIPGNPDNLPNPKRTIVELAQRSRRREIRSVMVPRVGSGRVVGPGYTTGLIGFVLDSEHGWRPDIAASESGSLGRCLSALKRLVAT